MSEKYLNSGALWKRQSRETDKAGVRYPHYIGKVTLESGQKNLAAWLNVDKKEGQPDISIKISEIQDKQGKAPF